MDYKLLVVTYYNDLPNFRMFLNLLNKFWRGYKKIKIVYSLKSEGNTYVTQEMILPFIQESVDLFLSTWDYQIVLGLDNKLMGWHEQQLNKMWFSASEDNEHTIIFDCQNFLTHDLFLDNIILNNKAIVIPINAESKHLVDTSRQIFDCPNVQMIPDPLTPWIWKNQTVLDMQTHLFKKYGDHDNWDEYPGSEFLNYFFYKSKTTNSDDFLFVKRRVNGIRYHHRIRNIYQIKEICFRLEYDLDVSKDEIAKWKETIVPYAIYNLY